MLWCGIALVMGDNAIAQDATVPAKTSVPGTVPGTVPDGDIALVEPTLTPAATSLQKADAVSSAALIDRKRKAVQIGSLVLIGITLLGGVLIAFTILYGITLRRVWNAESESASTTNRGRDLSYLTKDAAPLPTLPPDSAEPQTDESVP
jgi:hypothetical protein